MEIKIKIIFILYFNKYINLLVYFYRLSYSCYYLYLFINHFYFLYLNFFWKMWLIFILKFKNKKPNGINKIFSKNYFFLK